MKDGFLEFLSSFVQNINGIHIHIWVVTLSPAKSLSIEWGRNDISWHKTIDILGFRMKHIYIDKLNELEDTRLTPQ